MPKAAAAHQRQFTIGWRDYLEHQLGAIGFSRRAQAGTDRFIGAVRNAGIDPSTLLDRNLMTLTYQFLDGFRRRGDPCLAGLRLERNTNVHDYFSCDDLFYICEASALRRVRRSGLGPNHPILGGHSILQTNQTSFNRIWSETNQ